MRYGRVHGANHVGVPVFPRLLELHEASGVVGFQPLVFVVEYLAVAALVAQGPADDAGVVLVALYHAAYPVGMGGIPFRAIAGWGMVSLK